MILAKKIGKIADWTLVLFVAVAFLFGFYKYVVWNNNRNATLDILATQYEACVKKEMHTTPADWYNKHGEYPKCNK